MRIVHSFSLLLVLAGFAGLLNAQTVSENFEGVTNAPTGPSTATGLNIPSSGWTEDNQFVAARAGAAVQTRNWQVSNASYGVPTTYGSIWSRFNYTPSVTNYSLAMISPSLNGGSATSGNMGFDLTNNGYSTATAEYFEIWVRDNTVTTPAWTMLFQRSQNNAATTSTTENVNVPLSADFQIAFVVQGADSFNINEWVFDNVLLAAAGDPEIDVERVSGTSIADGGVDNVGTMAASVTAGFTWTIDNLGASNALNLTGAPVAISGLNNCAATVTDQPSASIGPGGSDTFDIDITPNAGGGAFSFTVTIPNNDADEGSYSFTVQGTGMPPYAPPTYTNTGTTGDYLTNIAINTSPAFNQALTETTTDYNYHAGVSANFVAGTQYTFIFSNNASFTSGVGVFIDYNGDGDYADTGEYIGGTNAVSGTIAAGGTFQLIYSIPAAATAQSATRFRVVQAYANAIVTDATGTYGYGQTEEYDAVVIPMGDPEINIERITGTPIFSGTTDSLGVMTTNVTTGVVWTIQNLGASNNLNLTGAPVAISGQSSCTAVVTNQPATTLSPGTSDTFDIDVTPTSPGAFQFVITIASNDVDEGTYTITVAGTSVAATAPVLATPATPFAGSPIMITEFTTNTGNDSLEVQNVTNIAFDATGWQVIISDDYTNINLANTITQTLGMFSAQQAIYWTDVTPNPWGNNIFWDPSGTGWIMVVDPSGVVMDFVCFNWTATDVAAMSVNAGGFTGLNPGAGWSGNGITDNGNMFARIGTADNDDATDWQDNGTTGSLGATNTGLTLPFATSAGATIAGTDPAFTGYLYVGESLGINFTADDANVGDTLNFTISVTGGSLTGAQAGFNESFPYTPTGGQTPQTASLTGTAANAGTIVLTVQVSDGSLTDTYTYTLTIEVPPEMDVLYNAASVAVGADVMVDVNELGDSFQFTIENTGGIDLQLTGTPLVDVTPGAYVASATVTANPTTPVANGTPTTFTIDIVPAAGSVGQTYDVSVSIANNDQDEDPYTFSITGTVVSDAPIVSVPTGSAWVNVGGGLFIMNVAPGATFNADLLVTDPNSDPMTLDVTNPSASITGLTNQPANITTATAGPFTLTWAGTAAVTNAPGNYDWTLELDDGNSALTIVTARIIIADVPPQHVAVGTIAGDGSAGTPYLVQYTETQTAADDIDIASVSDANTSQTLSVSNVAEGANPTSNVFTFDIFTGMLNVAPIMPLVGADVGLHTFTVTISDGGANMVDIYVEITVAPAPQITTTSPLPNGEQGQPYSQQFFATGGTGTLTFSASTALPGGLAISSGGLLSGTPTVSGPFNMTIRVTDAVGVFNEQIFALTLDPPATGFPSITTTPPLLSGTINQPYGPVTFTATGGTGTGYTWSITSGTLPSGLTLSPAGVLSGTPTTAGNPTVDVTVTDSAFATDTQPFTITVLNPGGGGGAGGGGGGGGGGCSNSGGAGWLALLALPAMLVWMRRRRA